VEKVVEALAGLTPEQKRALVATLLEEGQGE